MSELAGVSLREQLWLTQDGEGVINGRVLGRDLELSTHFVRFSDVPAAARRTPHQGHAAELASPGSGLGLVEVLR
jgi:hypothetical protein